MYSTFTEQKMKHFKLTCIDNHFAGATNVVLNHCLRRNLSSLKFSDLFVCHYALILCCALLGD